MPHFPKELLARQAWMVRPKDKQPVSAYEKRPVTYDSANDPNSSYWRWRWSVADIHSTYEQAKSYWDRHPNEIVGLTHVLHHYGDVKPQTRLICLDYDNAKVNGKLNQTVEFLLAGFDSFAEWSKSGKGVHQFVLVRDCPAFRNLLRQHVDGDTKVDVLCANPVAVTGNVVGDYTDLRTIDYSDLLDLPFFEYKEPQIEAFENPEWWGEDPLTDVPDHLRHMLPWMEMETAVEGNGGSLTLFAAACRLMRHGIVGREAEALLRCVPAVPPFPPEQIIRTIDCAYNHVVSAGEFNNPMPEFPIIEETTPEPVKLGDYPDDVEDRFKRYGFHVYSVAELEYEDLELKFLVDNAFIGEGALFIGGREKTFKTGMAADLLVSLATGTPFLNYFPTLERRSSVLFTAEIGMARAKHLVKAVTNGRGIKLTDIPNMDIVPDVPKFAKNKNGLLQNPQSIKKLMLYLQERKPEVAIFDPLYFAMGGASVGDMYEIGDTLRNISEHCQKLGVWPIFCHHSRKDSNKEFEPMELNDFYGSGVGAYARQWILLSHAEPFRKGVARLYANIGGSSQGARGIFNITIDEGQPDEICDRTWIPTVVPAEDSHLSDRQTILEALEGSGVVGFRDLSIRSGLKEGQVKTAVAELLKEDDPPIELTNGKITLLNGAF